MVQVLINKKRLILKFTKYFTTNASIKSSNSFTKCDRKKNLLNYGCAQGLYKAFKL